MSAQFRIVDAGDEKILAELFSEVDDSFFRPHPFTASEAHAIANLDRRDVYAILVEYGRAIAYGMLRGFDEGYFVPSLGIAVRTSEHGRGLGRAMMGHLHAEAGRRGATVVRLRVHQDNTGARRLYESLGYAYAGADRGELVMLVGLQSGGAIPPAPGTGVQTIEGKLLDCDAPEWEQTLHRMPYDFYHLPDYVALCAEDERARPCALYVSDGVRSMLLPLMIRPIPGGGLDALSPYGYPGPIGTGADDPEFLQVALVAGLQVLREAGLVSVFVRFHPLLNEILPVGVGTVIVHGDTVCIDLTRPAEEQWASTRLNHRRDIKRALQLGYTARMDQGLTRLEDFKRLYSQTMARRHAADFYFFGDSYFDRLFEALGERLHLCVVEMDGTLSAAGLFAETNGIVQYHLSGTDEASRAVQPTKLMMHFVRGWAKDRGDRALLLGGGVSGDADTLLHFKLGFSSLRQPFATLRSVIDEQEFDRLVSCRDPDLNPGDRTGFFPQYRLGADRGAIGLPTRRSSTTHL